MKNGQGKKSQDSASG